LIELNNMRSLSSNSIIIVTPESLFKNCNGDHDKCVEILANFDLLERDSSCREDDIESFLSPAAVSVFQSYIKTAKEILLLEFSICENAEIKAFSKSHIEAVRRFLDRRSIGSYHGAITTVESESQLAKDVTTAMKERLKYKKCNCGLPEKRHNKGMFPYIHTALHAIKHTMNRTKDSPCVGFVLPSEWLCDVNRASLFFIDTRQGLYFTIPDPTEQESDRDVVNPYTSSHGRFIEPSLVSDDKDRYLNVERLTLEDCTL